MFMLKKLKIKWKWKRIKNYGNFPEWKWRGNSREIYIIMRLLCISEGWTVCGEKLKQMFALKTLFYEPHIYSHTYIWWLIWFNQVSFYLGQVEKKERENEGMRNIIKITFHFFGIGFHCTNVFLSICKLYSQELC